jgi:antitoxin YefM
MLAKQTNYTNLRQNLASILDESIADRSVIIVTRQGKEDVAILAPENAQKLLAAMARADAIANQPDLKSESLTELCQELDIER